MRNPDRRDLERADAERRVRLVLGELERALEHVGEAEARAEVLEELDAAGLHPERRLRQGPVRGEVEAAPDPGHEVAPVVEVPVRDRDPVDGRPELVLAEPAENARPAVEQQARAVGLEHVSGVGAAGVRPGRRRADDGQAHRGILPMCRGRSEW